MEAIVAVVRNDEGFFLAVAGADRIFCHRKACAFALKDLAPGDAVAIGEVERTPRGLSGRHVSFIAPARAVFFEGAVTHVEHAKHMAFARAHRSQWNGTYRAPDDVFLGPGAFADMRKDTGSATFNRLHPGQHVRGIVRDADKGPRLEFAEVVETAA